MTVTTSPRPRTFVLLLVLSACSPGPDDAVADANDAGAIARGSAICQEWQQSYCEWNTACKGPSVACEQVKSIYCKSDDDAQRCAAAMTSSSCDVLPPACDVGVLADRSRAQEACENFAAAFCQRVDACSAGGKDSCVEQVENILDCRRALGVTGSFEPCMASLPNMDCQTLAVPRTCRGVLLLQ